MFINYDDPDLYCSECESLLNPDGSCLNGCFQLEVTDENYWDDLDDVIPGKDYFIEDPDEY